MREPVLSRGDVFQVNLDPTVGSEIKKERPCVVVQNDVGNKHSPVTIIIPITGRRDVKLLYPVNVAVSKGEGGLTKDSVVLCNQVRSIDKKRVLSPRGRFSERVMAEIDAALKIALGLK